jgi:hypothetical protein
MVKSEGCGAMFIAANAALPNGFENHFVVAVHKTPQKGGDDRRDEALPLGCRVDYEMAQRIETGTNGF